VPVRQGERIVGALSVGYSDEVRTELLIGNAAGAQDSTLVAALMKPLTTPDMEEAQTLTRELMMFFPDADLIALQDVEGRQVGTVIRSVGPSQDLSESPRIRDALQGVPSSGR